MNIIYHHPLPLDENATSASGIRPLKMLSAFKALGYKVDLVTGYSADRKICINKIKENISHGKKYDFVYSESSTMPTILTDTHHLPLHPFMDWLFFKFCKKNGIKIGLFYRDIYWAFESYGKGLAFGKIAVAKTSYYIDLLVYKSTLCKLYLPSLNMAKYVPLVGPSLFDSLPPGHDIMTLNDKRMYYHSQRGKTKIFYVGGLSDHYKMHTMFDVLRKRDDIELTICTRSSEWQLVKSEYSPVPDTIKVVHKIGAEMKALMESADLLSIFVEPQEYWEFAAPVKLYEYLGYSKPIIASKGTLSGDFVSINNVGWAIEYNEHELNRLFDEIIGSPEGVASISENIRSVAANHTWLARAQKVVKDLTS